MSNFFTPKKCELCNSISIKYRDYYEELLSNKLNSIIKKSIFKVLNRDTENIGLKTYNMYVGHFLVKCLDCGFASIQPPLREYDLLNFFNSIYTQSKGTVLKPGINSLRAVSQYDYLIRNVPVKGINSLLEFGAAGAAIGRRIASKNNMDSMSVVEPGLNWHRLYEKYSEVHITPYSSLFDVPLKAKYDLFLSSHGLQYVSNFDNYFSRAVRLVKKGGFLFFEVPNRDDNWFKMKLNCGGHTVFFSEKSIENIAKKYSLRLINSATFGAIYGAKEIKLRENKFTEQIGGRYLRFILEKP
jgi:SAM-dependent methyltransferase